MDGNANVNVFTGIELVNGTDPNFSLDNLTDKNKAYFIRTSSDGECGYIYFNNKCYGKSIDCGEY